MNTSLRSVALIWGTPVLLGLALATGLTWPPVADSTAGAEKAATGPAQRWTKVSVAMPTNYTALPPGNGADIANGQCLICHSADMVLRQPPLTQDEWTGEINKMRNSFGAPLPADQVDALARYLQGITSERSSSGAPSGAQNAGETRRRLK
jgi:mono/diheme cytochrome c family protein